MRIFLRFMFEDRDSFSFNFLWAQWHRHIDLVDRPFLPCSTIQPYFRGIVPVIAPAFGTGAAKLPPDRFGASHAGPTNRQQHRSGEA